MTPFVDDPDFKLYVGDVREVLGDLPGASVDCVVTSPPYWGLRDYGTGSWEGGDPDCDHTNDTEHQRQGATSGRTGRANVDDQRNENFRDVCGKCGARRVDAQIGLEPTPQEYVASIVEVFRLVRYVLADHGTVWLNLGDSYAGGGGFSPDAPSNQAGSKQSGQHGAKPGGLPVGNGLKAKDLAGIPWRVAFALQDDGWYLRSDIIWSKPNPMPESVTDRPTKSHEYVFLLSKQPRYYFDQEAVRDPYETKHAPGSKVNETQHYGAGNGGNTGLSGQLADVKARLHAERYGDQPTLDESLPLEAPRGPDGRRVTTVVGRDGSEQHRDGERWPNATRPQTARAIEIAREAGLTEAHLDAIRAVGVTDTGKSQVTQDGFGKNRPEIQALADEAKAVLGGYYREFLTPQGGRNIRSVWEIATQPYSEAHFATFPEALPRRAILAGCPEQVCRTCGKPRERIVDREAATWNPAAGEAAVLATGGAISGGTARSTLGGFTAGVIRTDVGWSDCGHADYRVGTVLDPFMGSGTTALVARKLARHAVGVELNPAYAELCARRLQQLSLFGEFE